MFIKKKYIPVLIFLFFIPLTFIAVTASENVGSKSPDDLLFTAIKENDINGIKEAISKGANINAPDPDLNVGFGGTPLITAIKYRHLTITQYLLENGARIIDHPTHRPGNTLYYMVKPLNKTTMDFLKIAANLQLDLNSSILIYQNITPLMYIVRQCSWYLQKAFIDGDEVVLDEGLERFSENDYFTICTKNIRFLMENGAELNSLDFYKDQPKHTVLEHAMTYYIDKNTNTLTTAPQYIADLKQILKPQYFSPAMWKIIQYLIDHGAKL